MQFIKIRKDVFEIIERIGPQWMPGNLGNLPRREKLGLQPVGEEWLPAIHVDLDSLGMSRTKIKWMRKLLRNSLDAQLGK